MFKKLKENSNITTLVEMWKNPKYRSAIILGLYLIFFIFVFSFINSLSKATNYNPTNTPVDALEQYKQLSNYQYRMEILSDNTKLIIGRRYQDKQIIDYNNNIYYLSDNNLYILEEEQYQLTDSIIEYQLNKFDPDFIYKLIKLGTLDYETKYSNDLIVKSYLVPQEKFINIEEVNIPESDPIRITISNDNNKITKVELDLTNLVENAVKNNYIVKLEYEFIGQIAPINIQVGGNNG